MRIYRIDTDFYVNDLTELTSKAETIEEIEVQVFKDWNKGNEYLRLVKEHKLAAGKPSGREVVLKSRIRRQLCVQFAFAIPSDEAIECLKAESLGILEVGAGTGYWARMVTEVWEDQRYIAYDNGSWAFPCKYYNIVNEQPIYNGQALFFCWPYMDSMAADWMKRVFPERVFYVGEWRGCTGDDEFHDTLEEFYEETESITIPQYEGIHDHFYGYRRKRKRRTPEIGV